MDHNNQNILSLDSHNAVDLDKFNHIIRGDIDLGLSLLMLFKKQAFEYLNDLNYAFSHNTQDNKPLLEAIHALKGASLSVAADKVTTQSQIIEEKMRAKINIDQSDYDNIAGAIQELLNYITAIEAKTKN
ncbi:MAG: hypothetical protein ACJARD_000082 [Alphaproteobacteria bacterium]|jgi:hypothetical protein